MIGAGPARAAHAFWLRPLYHTPPSIVIVVLLFPPPHIFLIFQAVDQSHDRHHQKQQDNEALEAKLLHVTIPSTANMLLMRYTSRRSWALRTASEFHHRRAVSISGNSS